VPELPEVEQARALIEARALNRVIVGVDDTDAYVCRPHAPGELAQALTGRTLTAARRRGKAMWFETSDDGPFLGLHLGMAGKILIDEAPATNAWDRFSLEFEDGGRLALRDRRRLGRAVLEPEIDALGPDAAEITRAAFRARIGKGNAPVKARLLDQHAIAGVGNLLADETLFRARIDPRRRTSDLGEAELDHLRNQLRAATRDAIRDGGVHTGGFVRRRGRAGTCPACGTYLNRGVVGGRTTYWCPTCQQ